MATSNRALLGQYAGFVTRAAALIIDMVIVSVAVIVINWVISLPVTYFLSLDVQACLANPANYRFLAVLFCRLLSLSWLIVTIVTAPLYFSILVSLNGQTVGKYVMGLRVVRMDGQRMTFFGSLWRWVGYFISAIPLGLGFFMSLVDERRRTLHDRLAKTCVVYAWPARRNEFFVDRVERWIGGDGSGTTPVIGVTQPALPLSSLYDLVAIDVPTYRHVRTAMNILTEGVAKGEFAIEHTAVLVRDLEGEIGVVGASDLDAEGSGLGLMGAEIRIPPTYIEALKADMPLDSFIILVLLLDEWADVVVKAVSRRVPALIRIYDVGDSADALTAKEGIQPTAVALAEQEKIV